MNGCLVAPQGPLLVLGSSEHRGCDIWSVKGWKHSRSLVINRALKDHLLNPLTPAHQTDLLEHMHDALQRVQSNAARSRQSACVLCTVLQELSSWLPTSQKAISTGKYVYKRLTNTDKVSALTFCTFQ